MDDERRAVGMMSSTEGRKALLVLAILGALANVIAVIQFAGSHLPVRIVGVLVLWVLLWVYGSALWSFLRRHRRDLVFLVLGGAMATSAFGVLCLSSKPAPPCPPPLVVTCASTPGRPVPSEIVYRAPTGQRYHRAGCRYVKGKAIPISLKEAKESGLTPCRVCHPPPLP
jgi:hypothetical protein